MTKLISKNLYTCIRLHVFQQTESLLYFLGSGMDRPGGSLRWTPPIDHEEVGPTYRNVHGKSPRAVRGCVELMENTSTRKGANNRVRGYAPHGSPHHDVHSNTHGARILRRNHTSVTEFDSNNE